MSPGGLFEDQLVQRQICNNPLEPRILSLKILQPIDLSGLQPAERSTLAIVVSSGHTDRVNRVKTMPPCYTSKSTWRSFVMIPSDLWGFPAISVILHTS